MPLVDLCSGIALFSGPTLLVFAFYMTTQLNSLSVKNNMIFFLLQVKVFSLRYTTLKWHTV